MTYGNFWGRESSGTQVTKISTWAQSTGLVLRHEPRCENRGGCYWYCWNVVSRRLSLLTVSPSFFLEDEGLAPNRIAPPVVMKNPFFLWWGDRWRQVASREDYLQIRQHLDLVPAFISPVAGHASLLFILFWSPKHIRWRFCSHLFQSTKTRIQFRIAYFTVGCWPWLLLPTSHHATSTALSPGGVAKYDFFFFLSDFVLWRPEDGGGVSSRKYANRGPSFRHHKTITRIITAGKRKRAAAVFILVWTRIYYLANGFLLSFSIPPPLIRKVPSLFNKEVVHNACFICDVTKARFELDELCPFGVFFESDTQHWKWSSESG